MNELLQELRVAQTGVQILFALLAIVGLPEALRRHHRGPALDLRGDVAALRGHRRLLVAPAAAHRFTFQRALKMERVLLGHRLFTIGLAMLALTLAGGVLLVLDVAVGSWFAVPVALACLLLLLSLW